MTPHVRQLRTVLTVADVDAARAYYRDVLGLREVDAVSGPDGAVVVVLDAGRATLELANSGQAAYVDEVEARGHPSGPVRLAFEVDDAVAATDLARSRGARSIAPPVRTPWESLNARLEGPDGIQVTLFEELATAPSSRAAGLDSLVGSDVASLGGEAGLLRRTVESAVEHGASGQLPFAAVVVRDGLVIGAGANTALLDGDPTAHGEVVAIRDAARRTAPADLSGAVVLSSCEPCAICRLVAHAAGVDEIVFATAKEVVPAWLDGTPQATARLIDAVTREVPHIARHADASLSAAELSAPFDAYRRAAAR